MKLDGVYFVALWFNGDGRSDGGASGGGDVFLFYFSSFLLCDCAEEEE